MRIPPVVRKHGATAFGLLLVIGAIYVVQREFRDLKWEDVTSALAATPAHNIWLSVAWTLLAYAVLTVYDRLGSVYAGKPISYSRTALASFCAYVMAHNLGFAAVSGAAVRYRFYAAWGLTPGEIAKVIAFTSLTFGLGGFALGGLVLLTHPEVLPWVGEGKPVPGWAAQILAVVLFAIVATYVVLARFVPHFTLFGHKIDLPGLKLAIAQVVLASVDVAVTAMIFYVLLPVSHSELTFLMFLGIYVAGYTAGLAASVPGGLGVFDGFMLLSLSPWLGAPQVLGAILLFRLFYYIIPLFLAGGLFVAFELSQRRAIMTKLRAEARVADALEVPAVAGLAGLAGVALLFLGALPGRGTPLADWAGEWVSLFGQFAASVVGSLLLANAWGLLRRLRISWYAGLFLLLNGAAILLVRGDSWILIGAVLAVALLLAVLRGAFYRDARLTAEPMTPSRLLSLAGGVVCGLTLATIAYEGDVPDAAWWEVVLLARSPTPLRFAVGLAAAMLLFAAFRLLRPARIAAAPYDEDTRRLLRRLGARTPEPLGGEEAWGALFAEGVRAGFAFRRTDEAWLAEGDPAGEPQARISAIWRFRDLCEAAGVEPAFVGIGRGMQRAYEDAGLTAVPLPDGRTMACRAEGSPQRIIELVA
ncbi:lysylphosphatidylglycerol synthase domain-containing protein [Roseomonas sp. OT10]|uniref:lysylphosphatidylglycerol synthase domain-containing protein n=1 Tax=Roseomonas cutis TaxID=2897332 RepID=UPI001E5F31E2|nr:lysylphosphatidylglycerol synthase domain-containing protein [Roseomonas sp. OT10]UFN47636.1 lysylphosphatidylglycerol synthase domain-containing protein [Roseomonas sp. OT10]